MADLITWSIYTSDGHYEGQASAFAPETAFREVISLSGVDARDVELKDKPLKGGGRKIIYNCSEFHLIPLTARHIGTGS